MRVGASRRFWSVVLAGLLAACSGGNNGDNGDTGGGDTGAGDGSMFDAIRTGDGTSNDGQGSDAIASNDGNGFDGAGSETGSGDGSGGDGSAADGGSSVHVDQCPGCPCFPGTDCSGSGGDAGTPMMCSDATEAPTLVYPPDQVLLPPNTNVLEVQFQPGAGNTLFEIDFQNAVTDVRIITRCNPITNTRGEVTGGCGYTLDMANWQYVSNVNRGGDPVHVTVRATPDGSCVGTSATRDISFATEDLQGGIYYWQSVAVGGVPAGTTGGIYRYDFGREDVAPEPFIVSGGTNGRCIGCHFVSRDGLRISYGSDDPDADDEYGDLSSKLMNVTNRVILSTTIKPGFRTFTHDHALMFASDGRGQSNPPSLVRYNGVTGAQLDLQPVGGARGTQPDWSPDDAKVVFVRPTTFLGVNGAMSATSGDDEHFFGGSLFTAAWSGTALGTPQALLMSTGENNFYPAYSPDGSFVVFNRVMGTGLAADAFANPNSRIWVMPSAGGTPVDLARLNRGDGLSNSWPRWSPYIQHDRGHSILWLTFSSVRDYGLRVQNEGPNARFCYPPESPENNSTNKNCPLVPSGCSCSDAGACAQYCVQPQIWMAAVEVDANGGITSGLDTSHPAFWLPFQELSAHNHIAEWVESIPGHTPPDGGTDAGTDAAVGEAGTADVVTTDVVSDAGGGMDAVSVDAAPMCGGFGATCGDGLPLCCVEYSCAGGVCTIP